MNKNYNNQGSIWRIWDLHVHSPASYGGDYKEFVNNVTQSIASVIGINDYNSLEGYQKICELGGISSKVIFPVVEMRMHNIVANRKSVDPKKAGTKINFHLIFDNDPSIFTKIITWFNSLQCFDSKGNSVQLGTVTDRTKISFDFEKVIGSLKEVGLFGEHCLVWLPYDEYGGIDEIDPKDNFFKLSLIKKAHIMGTSTEKQIKFFKWEDEKFSIEQYQEWFDVKKPCIKGSDAHKINYPFGCLRNEQSEPIEKYCWINSDTSFRGLKQILIEPDRVFIGNEPELIRRVRENKTKFIKSLNIKKLDNVQIDDIWFDDFSLDLNSALVAIIGNKGSGKSAITDILALCGNTHQDELYFSFLTKKKFKNPKPYNLSEKFQASLNWEDGYTSTKILNEIPDKNAPERVRYIPQNFLETLCSDIEGKDFERQIRQIIYSHTPDEKRLGFSSLEELIDYKSELIDQQIIQIKSEMSKLNAEIVSLEEKTSQEYQKSVENKLKLKRLELESHLSIKPIVPTANQTAESEKLTNELTSLRKEIGELEKQISEKSREKVNLYKSSEELQRAEKAFIYLDEQLEKRQTENDEFVQILTKYKIDHKEVFNYFINVDPITLARAEIDAEIYKIELLLAKDKPDSIAFKLEALLRKLLQKQEELDKPAKEQQKYLDELKSWEQQKLLIEGTSINEGSLKFWESQIAYLANQLQNDLKTKYEERNELLRNLFQKKIDLMSIKEDLYQPVTEFINKIKELKTRYDVQIDAMLEMQLFENRFLAFINQGKSGSFFGKEDGYQRLSEIREKANLNSAEGLIAFTDELVENLKLDKREDGNIPINVGTQLSKGKTTNELYDYVFHLDYVEPIYNLKLGNKTLSELSPGERGALLLIFYLILDKDDIPLIIDQPEDNLDNESIYHILVHFIKKVKANRQIIIVTHNPNLAIVCDAEQIVHIQIEKENKNKVKFVSGAIENDSINTSIINVLEGTPPAFNNRDLKYYKRAL